MDLIWGALQWLENSLKGWYIDRGRVNLQKLLIKIQLDSVHTQAVTHLT